MNSLRLQRLYGSKRPLVLVAVGFLVSIFIFYGRDTALKIVPLQVLRPNSPVTEPAEVPVEPTKSPVQPIKDPVEPTESLNESTKPVEQPTPTSILTPPVPTAYVGGQQNRGPQRVVNPFDDGDSLYRACLGPKNEEVSRQDGDTIISGFSWDPSGTKLPRERLRGLTDRARIRGTHLGVI
ncbi:hypothetical protein N7492_009640 [Penicillium capsulatum]|uniref:Uncharacterized protein n=1 Tax=Penicillium capsulatum TaxID=69766 RepID=A0A9W9LIA1_9EURO|nr:hypothetical protein N7492_009640 [Penicillium capsulatum]KAJ6107026.1 hypothetical protein N7512_010543 [Penicillium capsulatum]